MRIIKRTTLRGYGERFAKAAAPLDDWARLTLAAGWQNLVETRRTFPRVDPVKVRSGRTVTVLNLCGNDLRLLTAIHYDRQKVFILDFLTHAEYSRDLWKKRR